jgi:hypothetical protein
MYVCVIRKLFAFAIAGTLEYPTDRNNIIIGVVISAVSIVTITTIILYYYYHCYNYLRWIGVNEKKAAFWRIKNYIEVYRKLAVEENDIKIGQYVFQNA